MKINKKLLFPTIWVVTAITISAVVGCVFFPVWNVPSTEMWLFVSFELMLIFLPLRMWIERKKGEFDFAEMAIQKLNICCIIALIPLVVVLIGKF